MGASNYSSPSGEHPALFKDGKYLPLAPSGTFADNCVAFAREHEGQWIAVLAPRLSSRVGFPPIGEKWQDTAIELPESMSREGARELFTGRELFVRDNFVKLSDAMATVPFAVFTNQGAAI
jgi:(1->4)-alpha-D-glucan 1-alpha-D-glucosylmutase